MAVAVKTKNYWDHRYARGGNSGYGSTGIQADAKMEAIRENVRGPIYSITDVGCGDFSFGCRLVDQFSIPRFSGLYVGLDISEVVVERNKKQFAGRDFWLIDGADYPMFPMADLVVCLDVLFHVIEEDHYVGLLNALKMAWTRYLVITAKEADEPSEDHMKIRAFNPADFGEPIYRGEVEKGGTYIYVFKR